MSKQTKQLREAISLVLQAQSEELKEGAGSKAKATELNEKIDKVLNRVFMERSREIIQKLSESDLAKDEDETEDDKIEEPLMELDGLQLDEIEDIEDEANADGGDDLPPDEGDELGGDEDLDGIDLDAESGDEPPVDAEDDDINFDDIDFGGDEEDEFSADAGEGDDLDALGDEEEITDEEITQ